MEQQEKCWHFIMSSFSRIFGVSKAKNDHKCHEIALIWCEEHNSTCDIHLDDLRKVDIYFKKVYDEWQ